MNSLEDGPVGPKHVEIRLYMNKIETVTSVGFSFLMCRSWQDCCRRGENRSWPSVLVESVDSECWFLNNSIFCALIMRLMVEERVLIWKVI